MGYIYNVGVCQIQPNPQMCARNGFKVVEMRVAVSTFTTSLAFDPELPALQVIVYS
jgi:hypothetical protein